MIEKDNREAQIQHGHYMLSSVGSAFPGVMSVKYEITKKIRQNSATTQAAVSLTSVQLPDSDENAGMVAVTQACVVKAILKVIVLSAVCRLSPLVSDRHRTA